MILVCSHVTKSWAQRANATSKPVANLSIFLQRKSVYTAVRMGQT
jgi:hypothetical protein